VLADLDRDGVSEAVVASAGANVVSLVRRNGDVPDVRNLALGVTPYAVAAGDLDRDGSPDLVVSTSHGMQWLRGDGAGGFAGPLQVAPGNGLTVILADLNRDGLLDLSFSRVRLLGDGAGGFGEPALLYPYAQVNLGTLFGALGADISQPQETLRGPVCPTSRSSASASSTSEEPNAGGGRGCSRATGRAASRPRSTPTSRSGRSERPRLAYRNLLVPVDLNGDGAVDLVDARPNTLSFHLSLPVVRAPGPGLRGPGDRGGRHPAARGPERRRRALAVAGAALAGASDFAVVDDACSGRTVPAGAACALRVRFTPSTAGARAAEVVLTDNGGDSPQHLPLAGTGVAAGSVPPPPGRPRLPVARTTCTSGRGSGTAVVRCALRLDCRPGALRVALRLVRGGRVHAAADARGPGRLTLRRLRPLASGRYTLVTVVAIGARSRQARQSLVLQRP
jgi:hypothetical protein